jgi:hypothetical protein
MALRRLAAFLTSHTVWHPMIATLLRFSTRFARGELAVATRLDLRHSEISVSHIEK